MAGDVLAASLDQASTGSTRTLTRHIPPDFLPVGLVHALLDAVNSSVLVGDRSGKVLLMNQHARQFLQSRGLDLQQDLNLFQNILKTDGAGIFHCLERGGHRVEVNLDLAGQKSRGSIKWLPYPYWLVVRC